jgi:hypothetical protein
MSGVKIHPAFTGYESIFYCFSYFKKYFNGLKPFVSNIFTKIN